MRKLRKIFGLALCLLLPLLSSCVDEEQYANNPKGNFEALWRIIDEHYSFFDYKAKQYGLDWDDVYRRYSRQIHGDMTEIQLFEVLGNMLKELRDGHVNLYSSFDIARNWSFHEDYPSNISDSLMNKYLGTDYKIAGGMKYKILDDNIGYLRCATFQHEFGNSSITNILTHFLACNALIIDIRDNGGGMLTSAEKLAAHFTNEKRLVGYMQHKTGKGHNDFSAMEEQWLKPVKGLRWQKKVVVLTNRQVYSAANEFVKYMKRCGATIVGDHTGGGAGMPFSSELPNGWGVRFSACPMYDHQKQSTEFGIAPDYKVDMTAADFHRGIDTIIETGRKIAVGK